MPEKEHTTELLKSEDAQIEKVGDTEAEIIRIKNKKARDFLGLSAS